MSEDSPLTWHRGYCHVLKQIQDRYNSFAHFIEKMCFYSLQRKSKLYE